MILTYHKIHPETKTVWWVSPDAFYLQMLDLKSKKVVNLDEYDPSNPAQCVITFDGVYECVWKYAVPILKQFGYPFEMFIIGGTVGKDNSFDTVEPLAEFADLETLKKMIRAGGRLQWHSWSHARLAGTTDPADYEKELSVPDELRQLCPTGFKWYAYPHGERDVLYRQQILSRFTGALACDDGNDSDRYDLNRQTVHEDTRFCNSTVSLVIPCYNYGHLAAEAIESALLQTYPPDEILFIDDASSDQSVEVARRYEPRIRIEVNEENLGVVENFRKAVELTDEDYIVFLGADNRFRSDYVEQCKAILDANPDVGVVYTHFALFGPRASLEAVQTGGVAHPVAKDIFIRKFPEIPDKDIRLENYIHGSSMYRRVAYDQAGGYIKEYLPEDNSLFARMLELGWKARLWDAPSLEYRHHTSDQVNYLKRFEMENVYLRQEMNHLQHEMNRINQEIVKLQNSAIHAEKNLYEIRSSKAYQVSLLFTRIGKRIAPPGSWRRSLVTKILYVLSLPFRARHDYLFWKDKSLIRKSGFFDEEWYLSQNPDVAQAQIDPLLHFLLFGGGEGRDPGPKFSVTDYYRNNPDVKKTGINPLLHYIKFGKKEGKFNKPHGFS